MIAQQLIQATSESLLNVWGGVIEFIPSLIGAIIVLIIGLLVASGLKSLAERIINALKIDNLLRQLGLEPYLGRAGFQVNAGKFIGALVYWFVVIVSVLAISDILGLEGFSQFIRDVVSYVPNIIIAALIMLAAIIIANALRSAIQASVMGAKLHAPKFLGTLSAWAVIITGFVAALIQLGIAPELLNMVITGFVAMIALAGGLAFGLGGKDYAAHLINKLKERTE